MKRTTFINNTNTVTRDLTQDFQNHRPAEYEFVVAIWFRFDDFGILDEKYSEYFTLSVNQYTDISLGNGKFNQKSIPLEIY